MSYLTDLEKSKKLLRKTDRIVYTGCPTDMETHLDPILQFLKPHISKSKTSFEKFVKKAFR